MSERPSSAFERWPALAAAYVLAAWLCPPLHHEHLHAAAIWLPVAVVTVAVWRGGWRVLVMLLPLAVATAAFGGTALPAALALGLADTATAAGLGLALRRWRLRGAFTSRREAYLLLVGAALATLPGALLRTLATLPLLGPATVAAEAGHLMLHHGAALLLGWLVGVPPLAMVLTGSFRLTSPGSSRAERAGSAVLALAGPLLVLSGFAPTVDADRSMALMVLSCVPLAWLAVRAGNAFLPGLAVLAMAAAIGGATAAG